MKTKIIQIFLIFFVIGSAVLVWKVLWPSLDTKARANPDAVNMEIINRENLINEDPIGYSLLGGVCNTQDDPGYYDGIAMVVDHFNVQQEHASVKGVSIDLSDQLAASSQNTNYNTNNVNSDDEGNNNPCNYSDCPLNNCPDAGCLVEVQMPTTSEANPTELTDTFSVDISLEPNNSAFMIYLLAHKEISPGNFQELGWMVCDMTFYDYDDNGDGDWHGDCGITHVQDRDTNELIALNSSNNIYFQVMATGCYFPLLLHDADNDSNLDGDFANPKFGPYTIQNSGSGQPACTEADWSCTDWSSCVNNVQTRSCTQVINCQGGYTPSSQRSCSTSQGDNLNSSSDISSDITITNQQQPINTNSSNDTTMPTVAMTIPKEGDIITGSVTLTAKVVGAIKGLDFLWDLANSSSVNDTNVLIGAGRPIATNSQIWEKSWDTSQTPDGNYYVYARLEDQNGKFYLSNKVSITVDHELDIEIPPSASDEPDDTTDTDNEGVPDVIENEVGTNINDPDSDNDQETDYKEIINEKNPVGTGTLDTLVKEGKLTQEKIIEIKTKLQQIAFDEPANSGTTNEKLLKVLTIKNVSEKIGENKLAISGTGPPNTYLKIFIYSTPIVVTTKTDVNGNFHYVLDKNLLDGKHEAYVTVTDKTGKIKEKSQPYSFFIKRAQAVSEEEYLRGDVNVESETATLTSNYLMIALVIVLVVLIIIFGVYIVSRGNKPDQS